MKVALCYTGFATHFDEVIENHNGHIFAHNSCDVFVSTTNVFSQRYPNLKFKGKGKHYTYLKPREKWRKHDKAAYGIVYDANEEQLTNMLEKNLGDKLKGFFIKREDAKVLSTSYEDTKWQWLLNNQMFKINKAWDLVTSYEKVNNVKYDVIVNIRMDVLLKNDIKLNDPYGEIMNDTVYAFGGWNNARFMDVYLFGGFLYGSRDSMSVYYEMYNELKKPYEPKKKYQAFYKKHGDNYEYQIETHLKKNGINIKFINKQPASKRNKLSCYELYPEGRKRAK